MNPFRSHKPLGFYNLIKGHLGVDLNYIFEPIPCPVSGKVELVVTTPELGLTVYISDTETQAVHIFAHLSRADVKAGDHIQRNTVFGISGNSGHPPNQPDKHYVPHLHYEVIYFRVPDKKNPLPYDQLYSFVMSGRRIEGFVGTNIDGIKYLGLMYGKYQINSAGIEPLPPELPINH